jgi:hypothetical protein
MKIKEVRRDAINRVSTYGFWAYLNCIAPCPKTPSPCGWSFSFVATEIFIDGKIGIFEQSKVIWN